LSWADWFRGEFRVFRIASAAHPIFDGGGARRWGSRWCTPGRNIVHAASAYALAVLENLVHWNVPRLPPAMRYVVATVPAAVDRTVLEPAALPGWDRADYRASQAFGDGWYDRGETAVLIVPSVLSPFEPNVLINQSHPEARRITVGEERPAMFDPRLFQALSS
jgi:RES domain-containing protein